MNGYIWRTWNQQYQDLFLRGRPNREAKLGVGGREEMREDGRKLCMGHYSPNPDNIR